LVKSGQARLVKYSTERVESHTMPSFESVLHPGAYHQMWLVLAVARASG
jgi:hypothetical protein